MKKHPPSKDLRDIGQVVFPIEKMNEARLMSSCCVGVEVALETNTRLCGLTRRLSKLHHQSKN